MNHPRLTPEALRRRIREVLAKERDENPLRWWYLSFANDAGFLGAVIVRAHGMGDACDQAHLRGINPGGEVQGRGAPACFAPPESFQNRLLTKAEIGDLDRALLGAKERP